MEIKPYKSLTRFLFLIVLAVFQIACGSDESSTSSLSIATSTSVGGSISPTSATVEVNETTNFTVSSHTGYLIEKVSGCGGYLTDNTYTTGLISTNCTVTANFNIMNYTVSAISGANGSISPSDASVDYGSTTSFIITADTGFLIHGISGCSGTLSGDTYTTGIITADCSVTATFVKSLALVRALYPANGQNWNDYVAGNDIATAADSICNTASGTPCLHGGEYRVVEATGKSKCAGLTAVDSFNAFTWVCDDSTGISRLISTGLADGKYLSDLIDFTTPSFLNNAVTVYENGIAFGTTPSNIWWSNAIAIDNDGGDLNTDSTIYLATSNPETTYTFTANKTALIIQPGVTLTATGGINTSVINADTRDHLWLEGTTNASGVIFGISFSVVRYSVLRNVTNSNAHFISSYGIGFDTSSYNTLTDIVSTNNVNSGILLTSSTNNILSGIVTNHNSGFGILLDSSTNNTITNIITSNNLDDGILLDTSTKNTLANIKTSNNHGNGVLLTQSSENVFTDISTDNNSQNAITVNDNLSANNIFSGITAASNQQGVIMQSSSNVILGLTSTNNDIAGVLISYGDNTLSSILSASNASGITVYGILSNVSSNTFADVILANNSSFGVELFNTSENTFTGTLEIGNNYIDCDVFGGTNQGLDDSTCANNGTSDAILSIGVTVANSLVGKVISDDISNLSDNNGSATFPTNPRIFDWTNFDNNYRNWGKDGSAFPHFENEGDWQHGTGRIWDWSVSIEDNGNAGSPAVREVLSLPTGNDTLTHVWSGAPATNDNAGCNAIVIDSVWNGTACETTLLRRAIEFIGDGIGNENTLCESGETCLHMRNIGSYQGHGSLDSAGIFIDGTLTGITLMKHDTNGR